MHVEDFFRLVLAIVLVGCVGISGHYRRRARKESGTIPRTREHGLLILVRVLFALPLVALLIAYLIDPSWIAWSRMPLPIGVRLSGAVMGLACIPLVYWVVSSLGRNISETVLTKENHELVQRGPYRWVRHPLYAVGLLLLLASSLLTSSWVVLLLTAAIASMIRAMVIPLEEAALEARFGAEYVQYRSRTGGLLPRRVTRRSGEFRD